MGCSTKIEREGERKREKSDQRVLHRVQQLVKGQRACSVGGALLHSALSFHTDSTCIFSWSGVAGTWNGLKAVVLPLCAAICSPTSRMRSAPRPGGGGRFSLAFLRCCFRYSCSLRRCLFFSRPTWMSMARRTGISLVLVSSSSS